MSLEHAIQTVGGHRALARKIGVTYQAIQKWRAGRVPAERCAEIERATGGEVTRHDLRPDLFDPPATPAPTSEGA
jgi:DNA-binding transcriptional regulator YdaS (Cro superfamily)